MRLHVLRLATNMGHQRAILGALRYLTGRDGNEGIPFDAIVVMDADGQDDPSAIGAMLAASRSADIVFARRSQRAEGFFWVLAYHVYQTVFRVMLGQSLPFGNFCLMKRNAAVKIAREGDLTHLAATLAAYPMRRTDVPVARRERAGGQTKMSFLKLLDYGIAAMTASTLVWIRLFTNLGIGLALLSSCSLAVVAAVRLFTEWAIPGWASLVCLVAFSISFQAMGYLVLVSFLRRILDHVSPVDIALVGPARIVGVAALIDDAKIRRANDGDIDKSA